jgi:hypothetical protein
VAEVGQHRHPGFTLLFFPMFPLLPLLSSHT